MKNVIGSELKLLPYIAHGMMTDQALYNYPYFDDTKNSYFLPFVNGDNKFSFLMAIPFESFYYAKQRMDDNKDLFLDFFNILICEYSLLSTNTCLGHIKDNLLKMSAVFEKYFIYLKYISQTSDKLKTIIVWTEIEYFFGLLRSLYDHIQITIKHFVQKYMKKELKNSFAYMLNSENNKLNLKYDFLPQKISEYYEDTASFFLKCRDIREKIYHHGMQRGSVFYFEDGFGIDENLFDFSNFGVWPHDKIKDNGIVSLLGLLAYISKTVLLNLNTLGLAIRESFKPTNPFYSKDYKIFLRGNCIEHLNKLDFYWIEQWGIESENY